MMRGISKASRWLILAAAFASAVGLSEATAQSYGGDELPPGVLAVSIGGESIDLNTGPIVTDPTPPISGQLEQQGGIVTVAIQSAQTQAFTANVGANGAFSVTVPEPLPNGTHQLYLNNALVGVFTISSSPSPGSPTPQAPATGTANPQSGGQALPLAGMAIVAGAAAVAAILVRSSRRQRVR